MPVAEQVQLVQAYTTASFNLKEAVVRAVNAVWYSLGSWREGDLAQWLAQVLPIVEGSTVAMATMTDGYLAAVVADMAATQGVVGAAPAVLPVRAPYPRPVSPAEVYRRPFVSTWTSLSKDRPVTAAIEAGRARAVELVTTDLQLARRDATNNRLQVDTRVVGYRRVLTGSKSCAMCVLAARQRYRKDRLMPIHPGCSCGVSPIVGTEDPGQNINAQRARDPEALESGDLEDVRGADALHAAIAARFGGEAANARGINYRDLVVEHEHGELGPVMARRGDRFTSQADLG
jgi:hypothetical protein